MFLICSYLIAFNLTAQAANSKAENFNYIFKQGEAGFEAYRIPAIVKSTSGTLLAFAEARKKRSNGDAGDIDMVLKRSENNGKTWSNMITVWDDDVNTCGNPTPIVDEQTGRIHLLMTWNLGEDKWGAIVNGRSKNTRRPYYTFSDDDGKTWSKPVDITTSVKDASWDWYATGPVHGIQVKSGAYKGRLIAPSYFTIREEGSYKDFSHSLYSDDNGKTWKSGAPTPTGYVGECTIAELPDGKLMLNMRTGKKLLRRYSISEDGGQTWNDVKDDSLLTDPHCQGSLLSARIKKKPILLFSNPASVTRTNMTIKMSFDNGASWQKKYEVYSGISAYSDLVMISDKELAIFYEGGNKRSSEGLAFKIIPLSDIK